MALEEGRLVIAPIHSGLTLDAILDEVTPETVDPLPFCNVVD